MLVVKFVHAQVRYIDLLCSRGVAEDLAVCSGAVAALGAKERISGQQDFRAPATLEPGFPYKKQPASSSSCPSTAPWQVTIVLLDIFVEFVRRLWVVMARGGFFAWAYRSI